MVHELLAREATREMFCLRNRNQQKQALQVQVVVEPVKQNEVESVTNHKGYNLAQGLPGAQGDHKHLLLHCEICYGDKHLPPVLKYAALRSCGYDPDDGAPSAEIAPAKTAINSTIRLKGAYRIPLCYFAFAT